MITKETLVRETPYFHTADLIFYQGSLSDSKIATLPGLVDPSRVKRLKQGLYSLMDTAFESCMLLSCYWHLHAVHKIPQIPKGCQLTIECGPPAIGPAV